jgi:N-acetylmuramoyl-L-alanine amidase
MKLIILDPGHGGIFYNLYCTSGKRSPEIPPGFYEGVQVRAIATQLVLSAEKRDEYFMICPLMDLPAEVRPVYQPDVALKCRNIIYNSIRGDLLLSLHTNAKGNNGKWNDARGAKLFFRNVDPEKAKSFLSSFCIVSGLHNRGAELNNTFTILNSKHPAILIEMGFHTNKQDVAILKNIGLIAKALLAGLDAYFVV